MPFFILQKAISKLMAAHIIAVVCTLLIAVVAFAGAHVVRKQVIAHIESNRIKQAAVREILSQVAYGGAIHHLKNYVIRRHDGDRLRFWAMHERAQRAIENYRVATDMTERERSNLEGIRQMLEGYAASMRVIEGHTGSAREVDAVMRIDDTPFFEAVDRLALLTESQTAAVLRRVERAAFMAEVISGIAGCFCLAVLIGVATTTTRRAVEQLAYEKQQLLDDISKREAACGVQDEFLANMSHEIRTPMTSIVGYTDILKDSLEEEEIDRGLLSDHVETIRENANHLTTIIDDILDLSKLRAGKMNMEMIEVEPRQLIEQVLSVLRPQAIRKQVDLKVEIDEGLPERVMSDPVRLKQILINLVSNAIKFTHRGSVTLRAKSLANQTTNLCFEVADTGIGISAENQKHLFRAFQQADVSVSRRFGGTGLGLQISGRLAQLLGGSITVESVPEVGSTFVLRIHAVVLAAPPGTEASAEQAERNAKGSERVSVEETDEVPSLPLGGRRILFVEDGIDNQRLVCAWLKRSGAEVDMDVHGRLALERLSESQEIDKPLIEPVPYDLIITDIHMPVMDGYELTRRLRGKGHEGPILALTALALTGDREKCLASGCSDYLTKPVVLRELIETCRRLIETEKRQAA